MGVARQPPSATSGRPLHAVRAEYPRWSNHQAAVDANPKPTTLCNLGCGVSLPRPSTGFRVDRAFRADLPEPSVRVRFHAWSAASIGQPARPPCLGRGRRGPGSAPQAQPPDAWRPSIRDAARTAAPVILGRSGGGSRPSTRTGSWPRSPPTVSATPSGLVPRLVPADRDRMRRHGTADRRLAMPEGQAGHDSSPPGGTVPARPLILHAGPGGTTLARRAARPAWYVAAGLCRRGCGWSGR
jgi:hypothetical protein